jgi:hypothetical protein
MALLLIYNYVMNWILKNKIIFILFFAVGVVLVLKITTNFPSKRLSLSSTAQMGSSEAYMEPYANSKMSLGLARDSASIVPPMEPDAPPVAGMPRMVVQNSYLSLLVKSVVDTKNAINDYVSSKGGYMVSSSTSNPQDQATATITFRIPSDTLTDVLHFFRQQAVKVVSEELTGNDVTDEYVDIDTRIAQLEQTKARMNELLEDAREVSDLVNITSQITNIQQQIDSLKGRQQSLAQNAELSKVTVYLSTDELALPYAPENPFRPEVIVKLAIRSLLSNLQQLAALVIWVGVYSIIWLPLLIIGYLLYRRFNT